MTHYMKTIDGVSQRLLRSDVAYHQGRYYVPTTDETKWVENWKEFREAGGNVCFNEGQSQIELLLPAPFKFSIKFQDESLPDTGDLYMIWSNEHRAWWRDGHRGYSAGTKGAGLYSREEALEICRNAIPSSAHVGRISEIPVRRADVTAFLAGQMIPAAIVDGGVR